MFISISRALTEIKTLDARIDNLINGTLFVASVKKSSTKINNVYTREEFEKTAKANFQSLKDLMERRRLIKSAVVKSNANTMVKIGDKEYVVADAIERKRNIGVEQEFLDILEKQYRNAISTVNLQNDKVDKNLDNLLNSSLSADSKKETNLSSFAEAYKKDNYFEVVDILNLKDYIEVLKTDLLKFESEFNICLTESNSITTIEIPD